MPKIKRDEVFEESEEEDASQFIEDEGSDEDLEAEEQAKPKGQLRPGLKAWQDKRRLAAQQQQQSQQQPQQPQAPKRRYGIVAAQPIRIVDAEGQEVIAEGDYLIPQALTDIIERLERIENTLGSMVSE